MTFAVVAAVPAQASAQAGPSPRALVSGKVIGVDGKAVAKGTLTVYLDPRKPNMRKRKLVKLGTKKVQPSGNFAVAAQSMPPALTKEIKAADGIVNAMMVTRSGRRIVVSEFTRDFNTALPTSRLGVAPSARETVRLADGVRVPVSTKARASASETLTRDGEALQIRPVRLGEVHTPKGGEATFTYGVNKQTKTTIGIATELAEASFFANGTYTVSQTGAGSSPKFVGPQRNTAIQGSFNFVRENVCVAVGDLIPVCRDRWRASGWRGSIGFGQRVEQPLTPAACDRDRVLRVGYDRGKGDPPAAFDKETGEGHLWEGGASIAGFGLTTQTNFTDNVKVAYRFKKYGRTWMCGEGGMGLVDARRIFTGS